MNTKLDEAYKLVKGIENVFPIPTPVETVQVGTFDVESGEFTGLQTEVTYEPGRTPPRMEVPPVVYVNAVNVNVQFNVINLSDSLTVMVGNQEATIYNFQNSTSVTINVGSATGVKWQARSGRWKWADELVIQRPSILGVGMGVFTVPALPVAIVYAPPTDNPQNRASYSSSISVGTRIMMSFGEENSAKRTMPGDFDYLERFTDIAKGLATALELLDKSNKELADTMQKAADGLKSLAKFLFGGSNSNQTVGTNITSANEVEVTTTITQGFSTTTQYGGPGSGDLIYYLTNARLVWLASNGRVRLTLLGADEEALDYIKDLRDDLAELKRFDCRRVPLETGDPDSLFLNNTRPQTKTPLDCATLQALLDLDPFVGGGEQTPLLPPRFELQTDLSGTVPRMWELKKTSGQTSERVTTNFSSKVTDIRSGFLSFLGIGSDQSKSVMVNSSLSSLTAQTQEQTVLGSLFIAPPANQRYDVNIYFDNLFGTIAFQNDNLPRMSPVISGRLFDAHGKPVGGEVITLVQEEKEFLTHTEADGHYGFHASTIIPGGLTLIVGKVHRELQLDHDKPIHDADLRLHD